MAKMDSHQTELGKTISLAERDRRGAAVRYARALVGLERFSLNAADGEHPQQLINGYIELA